jgi:hypothetical protein
LPSSPCPCAPLTSALADDAAVARGKYLVTISGCQDCHTPGRALAVLTKPDVVAVVAYLRSLPPVANKVPGPFGPGETPTSFVMRIVPPGAK